MPIHPFRQYISSLHGSLSGINSDNLQLLEDILYDALIHHRPIYIIGNGGSHANSSHIAGDYQKTFALASCGIKISSLADNICYYTAAVNDLDPTDVYQLLIGKTVLKADILIYLSGSGNSSNLIKSATKAKLHGIFQISLTAFTGGTLSSIVDLSIHIPTNDMEQAEDAQLIVFHYIKQRLMARLESIEDLPSLVKYNKRVFDNLIA